MCDFEEFELSEYLSYRAAARARAPGPPATARDTPAYETPGNPLEAATA